MRKKTEDEYTPFRVIRDMTGSDAKAYWVIWKYAPDLLPTPCKTYEELQENYAKLKTIPKNVSDRYILAENVQKAIKWLLKRGRESRKIDLYNRYFDLAMGGNTQALQAYLNLDEAFFANQSENEELTNILKNASFTDNSPNCEDNSGELETEDEEDFSEDL